MPDQSILVTPEMPAGEAIPRLLDAFGGRIYSLGLRICGSSTDAEDLLQDTFLQAFRRWSTFEGRSSPATWLHTIAANACARRHRKRAGEPDRIASIEQLMPTGDGPLADPAGVESGPLSAQIRREAIERVERAIISLPESYRLPLILKDVLELSTADVADALDMPEGTVKTRVHRARLLLRNEMANALPARDMPPLQYERQVCLDLLRAKLEAMDRHQAFPVGGEVVCERCRAIFESIDLAGDLCRAMIADDLPADIRSRVLATVLAASPANPA
jgi:RNA polymerase sigma-70 factor (ECF subfamily)